MSGRVPSRKVMERAYVTDRVRHTKLTAGQAREEFKAGIAVIEREAAARALIEAADALSRPSEGAGYEVWASGAGDWLRARAADACEDQGFTTVRAPWVKKGDA